MTYDVLFQPLLTLVVTEDEQGVRVTDAEVDWEDSFLNVWRNDPETGGNCEEVVPDGDDPSENHIANTGTEWLDMLVAGAPALDRERTVKALRALADLIESN